MQVKTLMEWRDVPSDDGVVLVLSDQPCTVAGEDGREGIEAGSHHTHTQNTVNCYVQPVNQHIQTSLREGRGGEGDES